MYDTHYGLSGRPFALTPDPSFWFETATHKKAMAYLGYGLSQSEGFIVITGEPGTGKTTLVGHLMARIDPERLNVIRIVTTQVDPGDLLHLVAAGLDVLSAGMTKSQLLSAIERGLHAVARTGKRTLLIVDEAQSLPIESLEELRMLSNFQVAGHSLLQIFLLGQPEFRRLLNSPRLEQLRQRVIAIHHLGPMEPEEAAPYLIHRLSRVCWNGRPDFTEAAVAAMYEWAEGIPRRLNMIANRVMLLGAVEGIEQFEDLDVETVAAELSEDAGATDEDAAEPASLTLTGVPVADEPRPMRAAADPTPPKLAEIVARIEAMEARMDEQDAALRRVLALLVDWVEGDHRRIDLTSLRGSAA